MIALALTEACTRCIYVGRYDRTRSREAREGENRSKWPNPGIYEKSALHVVNRLVTRPNDVFARCSRSDAFGAHRSICLVHEGRQVRTRPREARLGEIRSKCDINKNVISPIEIINIRINF